MTLESLIYFLIAVALGSYVQTVTGFAIGLIVMGTVTTFDLAPIPFSAIVVCFLVFWNGLIALRRNHATVDWKITRLVLIGALDRTMLSSRRMPTTEMTVSPANLFLRFAPIGCTLVSPVQKRRRAEENGGTSWYVSRFSYRRSELFQRCSHR